ncbi:maltose O-acetyltransferase, partial [Salmonella enterica]|nr:maltose O-acetyltransferase [Salmonella enterica]
FFHVTPPFKMGCYYPLCRRNHEGKR